MLALTDAALRARPVAGAEERVLPVAPVLAPLVPRLRRGLTVSVRGATSLALLLAAGPSAAGLWVAAVDLPALGGEAAAEAGVDLARLAFVTSPGPGEWSTAVAAVIDGVDVVLAGVPPRVRAADARRLSSRAHERGALLVLVGDWPERAELRLATEECRWAGVGAGHGHLTERTLTVVASGREIGGRDRCRATLTL